VYSHMMHTWGACSLSICVENRVSDRFPKNRLLVFLYYQASHAACPWFLGVCQKLPDGNQDPPGDVTLWSFFAFLVDAMAVLILINMLLLCLWVMMNIKLLELPMLATILMIGCLHALRGSYGVRVELKAWCHIKMSVLGCSFNSDWPCMNL